MLPWLNLLDSFPDVENALKDPNGLLAIGADLSTSRILTAYRAGIFPWYNQSPILWWSPNPRMVLFPEELKVSRSLQKVLDKGIFETQFDTRFRETMLACAEPREGQAGTWINEDMIKAYTTLHTQGWAHSVETWREGKLVGGLYGIAIGRVFFGESMFARQTDASKIALVRLVNHIKKLGLRIIDCQVYTAHLASLGAREIPRSEFTRILKELVNYESITGSWEYEYG